MYVHRDPRRLSEIPQSSRLVHPRPRARLSCWLSMGVATREWADYKPRAGPKTGPRAEIEETSILITSSVPAGAFPSQGPRPLRPAAQPRDV
jgi:hypothetical protein